MSETNDNGSRFEPELIETSHGDLIFERGFLDSVSDDVGVSGDLPPAQRLKATIREVLRIVRFMDMAPIEATGWTAEHSRASRFVTALIQKGIPNPMPDEVSELINDAARATWIHVPGTVKPSELPGLVRNQPIIEAYTVLLAN